MTYWEAATLIAGTLGLMLFSKRALLVPRSHGFPRFFALEFLLILIVFNAPRWFQDPWCVRQVLSWVLLFLSIPMAAGGYLLLKRRGRPGRNSDRGANFEFENTTRLVTDGIYRYLRHPMYSSLLLLGAGILLKDPTVLSCLLYAGVVLSLTVTAKIEEGENIERFGEEYRTLMMRTKMFIPFVV